jgi:NifU-like protein
MQTYYTSLPAPFYPKKLIAKIENSKFAGSFKKDEALARQMRLVEGRFGYMEDGNMLILYWLVDETDGVIADVKFQAFGPSALIGAAECGCELLIRKNYDQAKRISCDLIDKQARDKPHEEAFPSTAVAFLNFVLEAIECAAEQCLDIPLAETYVAPPIDLHLEGQESYPGWIELSKSEKIAVIEAIIDREIRPYIELDAGGIQILDLLSDKEVLISYQGSCTTCYSATGATLNAIQQILRAKIDPEIVVTPDLSNLSF